MAECLAAFCAQGVQETGGTAVVWDLSRHGMLLTLWCMSGTAALEQGSQAIQQLSAPSGLL